MTRLQRMPAQRSLRCLRSLRRPRRTTSLIRYRKNCSRRSPEGPPGRSGQRSSRLPRQGRRGAVRRHDRRTRQHVQTRHSRVWVSEGTSGRGVRNLHYAQQVIADPEFVQRSNASSIARPPIHSGRPHVATSRPAKRMDASGTLTPIERPAASPRLGVIEKWRAAST